MSGPVTDAEFFPALDRMRDPGVGFAHVYPKWRISGTQEQIVARLRQEFGESSEIHTGTTFHGDPRNPVKRLAWAAHRPGPPLEVVFYLKQEGPNSYSIEMRETNP